MRNARARFWTFALLMFAIWLIALLVGGDGSAVDASLRNGLYAGDQEGAAKLARFATWAGSWMVLTAAALLAATYLFFRRRMRAALLLIAVFGGRLLVEVQKMVTSRERPGVADHLEAVQSLSFPSAHAANAMITFVAIGLLVPVGQKGRASAVTLGLVAALIVGWSRVALGVHWPTDVIGGWAFGLLWIATCMRLASARPEAEPSVPAR